MLFEFQKAYIVVACVVHITFKFQLNENVLTSLLTNVIKTTPNRYNNAFLLQIGRRPNLVEPDKMSVQNSGKKRAHSPA